MTCQTLSCRLIAAPPAGFNFESKPGAEKLPMEMITQDSNKSFLTKFSSRSFEPFSNFCETNAWPFTFTIVPLQVCMYLCMIDSFTLELRTDFTEILNG